MNSRRSPIAGRWVGTLMVVLALSVPPRQGQAGEHRHRVGSAESLRHVAKNYYGATWKVVYLLARNSFASESEARPGKLVIIPASWIYKVRRRDTLAIIAARYLGDTDRYKALMQFNNLRSASGLEEGQSLLMPFHLRHTVKPGEGYSHIAQRYYRTTRLASLLMGYNGGAALKPGQSVTVPIFDKATVDAKDRAYKANDERVTAAARPEKDDNEEEGPPEADPGPQPSAEEVAQAKGRLDEAVRRYQEGYFEEACADLERLLADNVLSGRFLARVLRQLGFCAVANGDGLAAKDYFRKWLELEPRARLDPVRTSPKILAIVEEVAQESKTQ